MSRRMSITIICDECGRISEHELVYSGFDEQIYTAEPYPKDWVSVPLQGGSDISPQRDYCPPCHAARRCRKEPAAG